MKIIYVTPTYFGPASCVGGGERYAQELARWMAGFADTTLVSFGQKRCSYRLGALAVELYRVKHYLDGVQANPFSLDHLHLLLGADVIHCHQVSTMVADLGCLVGTLSGKRVFVTNHGGGGGFVLNRKLPILQLYSGAFANSGFAVKVLPKELRTKAVLVKGGVDIGKFAPDRSCAREKKILYVGRIVPHKGLDVLIEALRLLEAPGYRLTIVGHTRHDRYYGDIKRLARGLDVEFIHDADDEQLLHHYRSARVTVLPSVHTDCYGNYHPMPELMGFTLLESQACGTPVVCTDAGGMHEFVDDGRTGFVVTQGSPAALAAALKHLVALSDERYAELGRCCRAWVEPLSWKAVARRHLELYETLR